MQEDILKKMDGTSPGLNLDEFYNDMTEARELFIQKINEMKWTIKPSADSKSISILLGSLPEVPVTLDDGNQVLSSVSVLDLLKQRVSTLLENELNGAAGASFAGPQQDAIVGQVFLAMNSSGMSETNYSASSRSEYIKGIAGLFK